jgi:predicted O-methyltransferase YrrM
MNLDRFSGLGDVYDRFRPKPPAAVCQVLTQLAGADRARLVVDIGSGTGLSTLVWAPHADLVIGIEPNADMRRVADARKAALPAEARVEFRDGSSGRLAGARYRMLVFQSRVVGRTGPDSSA